MLCSRCGTKLYLGFYASLCSCDAQSLRQEEFTNLSLDLVPEATVEQMLQLYLTVGLLSRPPAHSRIRFFPHTARRLSGLFLRRKPSWSSGVIAEAQSRARGFPLQLCRSE